MSGSIVVLADLHLGRPDAPGLQWGLRAMRSAKDQGAEFFIFAGNLIDRAHVNAESLADAFELFRVAGGLFAEVHFVAGNHDVYFDYSDPEVLGVDVIIHGTDAHSFACGPVEVHTAGVAEDGDERRVLGDFGAVGFKASAHLGILHTSANGDFSRQPCLPAPLDELRALNYDAWILGHVHTSHILQDNPFIGWVGMGGVLLFDASAGAPFIRRLAVD